MTPRPNWDASSPPLSHLRPLGPGHLDRFAPILTDGIKGSELVVFEHLSHAGLPEDAEGFNQATLEFLTRQKL